MLEIFKNSKQMHKLVDILQSSCFGFWGRLHTMNINDIIKMHKKIAVTEVESSDGCFIFRIKMAENKNLRLLFYISSSSKSDKSNSNNSPQFLQLIEPNSIVA